MQEARWAGGQVGSLFPVGRWPGGPVARCEGAFGRIAARGAPTGAWIFRNYDGMKRGGRRMG